MSALPKPTSFEPTKKAFSLFEEFKNFAFKGNVVDLATGGLTPRRSPRPCWSAPFLPSQSQKPIEI
jgi:hypothetical protein